MGAAKYMGGYKKLLATWSTLLNQYGYHCTSSDPPAIHGHYEDALKVWSKLVTSYVDGSHLPAGNKTLKKPVS